MQTDMKNINSIIQVLLPALICLGGTIIGNDLYSYVNSDGIKVYTNIGARKAPRIDAETPIESLGIDSDRISPEAVYYEDVIQHYSSRHQVSEDLVKAVIQVESNYDPFAVSVKNCKGLMQLHPDTARRFGVKDVFNPEENIAGGIKYLGFLIDHFDDNLDFALAAYNSGENTVKKYNGIPPYPETIRYVEKVKSLAGILEAREETRERPVRINRIIDSAGNVTLTNFD